MEMAIEGYSTSISKLVDGFPIPSQFSEENFHSAIRYKPQPDDIFIVTYPKCGTTWVQHILMLILRHGQPFESIEDIHDRSPFLENRGAKCAETMERPGSIKTHLPFHLAPWSPSNKYIYVARNPKDCCVSYYHHELRKRFSGTFEEYFEMFLSGLVNYGDYFDHLLGWYTHSTDPNVLFITYEALKEDFEGNVMKIASFVGDRIYAEPIRKNHEIMENIEKYSTFEYIKDAYLKKDAEYKSRIHSSDRELKETMDDKMHHRGHHNRADHFRKGIIGDWKNYFSEEQTRRLNEKFMERTKGTDLENLWSNNV